MNHPQSINFQALKSKIHAEAEAHKIEIISEDESSITILDLIDDAPKEITFTNPKAIDTRWLRRHVWIHPSITGILTDELASAMSEMDPNTFITLRHLIILPQQEAIKEYIDSIIPNEKIEGFINTAPLKCRTK